MIHSLTTKKRRIIGLDIARAVAIVGMTADHFGPAAWAPWVSGWPSLLFAFLAGMSMILMTNSGLARGLDLSMIRRQVAIRGAFLVVVGVLLASAGPDMIIVLTTLGTAFILCTALLGLSGRALLSIGVIGMLTLPQISFWLRQHLFHATGDEIAIVPRISHFGSFDGAGIAARALFLDGMYPVITWFPVIVVGMAVMKIGINGVKRLGILVAGISSVVVSSLFTWVMVTHYDIQPMMLRYLGMDLRQLSEATGVSVVEAWRSYSSGMGTTTTAGDLLLNGAHTGSTPDLLLHTGISLVIVALCLWIGDLLGKWAYPLVALGSCAFTVYVGQALVSAAINHWFPSVHDEPGLTMVPLACYLGVPLLFCMVWKQFFPRGPLEQVMFMASTVGQKAHREPVESKLAE